MAEILKLYMLGIRLLLNPNKSGCEQLLLSTEYSKVGVVGAFLTYKMQFEPIKHTIQQIFRFQCMIYTKLCESEIV